ncbi:MAG TPA: bifunctional diaminohydroxyphosphoribosylaminopyrimidine deaminase/5-amino-6-(5-phosphoribosylamino)uracil reductase RibD [Kiritimatiellia bacterium]|nr:bifunctional diaminohydroxyphosphoribosylaminopyrimidine deaminase/5-amino-6-(5-phosphoribosylamino)uracil reductase RibD [Kiritimatiellia bacterium]
MERDAVWMGEAVAEARRGVGLTRPNPPVGAVVVAKGKVVGRGFHPQAGKPHAEVYALAEAGRLARGATLYVTLEPCSTTGRTPPCTEAIKAAGIARVVYGCRDPNPRHAGRADRLLEAAGIAVTAGVLEEGCGGLIRPFAMFVTEGRPWVTLKLAVTLDGRIADRRGTSQWITGEEARASVQDLRRTADAILVGAETLRADDPSLLPRPALGRKPWRAVVAGSRRLPLSARLFTDPASSRTVVFATEGHRWRPGLVRAGIDVVDLQGRGRMAPVKRVLGELAERSCLHVVCEGGGILAGELLKADVVDEIWLYLAPKLLGGGGRASVGGPGWLLQNAPRFRLAEVIRLGDDVLLKARK